MNGMFIKRMQCHKFEALSASSMSLANLWLGSMTNCERIRNL